MIDLIVAIPLTILPPCQTEDSSWCHWDAQSQGNGQGTSYVALWPADPAPLTITLEVNR